MIVPRVRKYYGIDISGQTLDMTERRLIHENINNVTLRCLDALEINCLEVDHFDLVIMNSVVQYFPNYDYFINVINICTKFCKKGRIFVDDILDLEYKEEYEKFRKRENRDLYYPKQFFCDLVSKFPAILDVTISDKIGTIQNELTKYRFDVLIEC